MQVMVQRLAKATQRIGAAVLLFVCLLPLLTSLGALTSDPEAALPACCRTHGAHHCTLPAEQRDALLHGDHFTEISSPCLLYPHAAVWPGSYGTPSPITLSFVPGDATAYLVARQMKSLRLHLLDGEHHKRGPPHVLSS